MKHFTPITSEQSENKLLENNLAGNEKSQEKIVAILEALPLCVNLWTSDFQNIMCNQKVVDLFGLKSKEEYLQKFYLLSPAIQPDGRPTSECYIEYMSRAVSEGECIFNWMHCTEFGEEIPAEITLYKLDVLDEKGGNLVVGFTRDLRSQMMSNGNYNEVSELFFDQITDRALFKSITDLSDEWFYLVDNKRNTVQFFGKGKDIIGFNDEKQNFPADIFSTGVIYEEDLDVYNELSAQIIQGKGADKQWDIRFNLLNNEVRYYRFIYKTITNKVGEPLYSIGKAQDVHEQKSLEVLSQTDLLTNCYNKVTSENLIIKAINDNPDGAHALFIIDVDNFKSINDNKGHLFGDLVLKQVAQSLHTNFRSVDILGRLGGDEFVVFVKNISDLSIVARKAEVITEAFRKGLLAGDAKYKISGSVGIALYPQDGSTYEDIYEKADKALYQSKMKGKDCYTFYSDDFTLGTMDNLTIINNACRLASGYFDSKFISNVFDVLYKNDNQQIAINSALEMIASHLDADRAYIVESFNDGATYSCTFEWSTKERKPQIENFVNIPRDILKIVAEPLDEKSVFYNNDILKLDDPRTQAIIISREILSYIAVQVMGKENKRFILALDDCRSPRVWGEKEVNSLNYLIKMLALYLNK